MNSGKILYSKGKNDECFTPYCAVHPILEFIPKDATVWCPFDTEESMFVKAISKTNKVVYSHINAGQDFFEYEPKSWDVIVSNPPFTKKRKYFERALAFKKPFALIMTNVWLNDSAPLQMFADKELQLLMFDKRISFLDKEGNSMGKPTFSSSYYCWNFLPKQIVIKPLEEWREKDGR
jgi:hypothetical protein